LSRITNRRWAISAFGTASSAALSDADTVYCITPLYHPSGLLMSIGGAVAGGARVAVGTRFEPSTFWEEVRRYGVTVASYTWTLLHDLVEASRQPGERHHRVRLFIGSGMPRGLWRRVQQRFKPARVLEFYAATEAGAILVNVGGSKPGSMGRPLPGSAEVRVAAYDLSADELSLTRDGFARECSVNEVGLLLVRVRPSEQMTTPKLRGVFSREDAWVSTGDLFRRDGDGDFWRIDSLAEVILTAAGPAFTVPIRDALEACPDVDLAVAYGVRPRNSQHEIAIAAVTLCVGHELQAREVGRALLALEPHERPAIVRVVDEIPVTTWFRPLTGPLREAGVPRPEAGGQAWYRDASGETYRPLTKSAYRRLIRAG
jgi:putative long chain acyl-CoA synthase